MNILFTVEHLKMTENVENQRRKERRSKHAHHRT